jgi:hypothetical protein
MTHRYGKIRLVSFGIVAVVAVVAALVGPGLYQGTKTIRELLTENKHLKQAISNLTAEDQIGYAKVISQREEAGQLLTTIRFVETARGDKTRKILQKEYTLEGDIIHFDALIVKFEDQMVLDGKSRALYLWRRIYGEKMAPESGYAIEECGAEPKRYAGLLEALHLRDRQLFWTNIWGLANDPEKLRAYGIRAIYGNVTYQKLRPGLIYVFKISPTGQVSPETIPEM